jgi:hypothetical protein
MNARPGSEREAGYILLSVLVIVFVLVIVGAAFLALAGGETKASQQNLDSQRAFWLAEAGKHRAIRWMSMQLNPPGSDIVIYQDVVGPDGGAYTVNCLVDTSAAWAAQKAFVLDCVGTVHGVQRRVRQHVQMLSFAQYAYFTDDETNPGIGEIWFISADVIQGRTHSNGTFHMLGTPTFQGLVSSASNHMIGYPNFWVTGPSGWPVGGNNPTFEEGFDLSVAQIPLPTQTLDLKVEAQTGGIYTAPEAELELGMRGTHPTNPGVAAAGWLRYRNFPSPAGDWTERQISGLGKSVFYCNNDLHVKAGLNGFSGELTVASNRNVRIEDDIRYAASNAQGAPNPGCKDLLGIVAGNNVIFEDNAANNNNLIVDAVLMALNTSITAENYDTRPVSGTLTIWGGLIQKFRGPVGTTWNAVIQTGYRKDYHYDTRVTGRTPPAFPLTGTYEESNWEETWDASNPF